MMKNNFKYLVAFFVLISIAACSGDDSASSASNRVLVKKITQTSSIFNEPAQILQFEYDGTKLSKLISGDFHLVYSYDGNKISTVGYFYQGTQLTHTKTFNYEGEQLVSIIDDDFSSSTTSFTYDQSGKLATETFGHEPIQGSWIEDQKHVFSYSGENVSGKEIVLNTGSVDHSYTFDNHPNAFRDMNRYFRLTLSSQGYDVRSQNNALSHSVYNPQAPGNFNDATTYDITYNESGFPEKIVKRSQNGTALITTLFEYQ